MEIGDYVYVTLARNRGAFRVDNEAEPCKTCKGKRWYLMPLGIEDTPESSGKRKMREYLIVHEKYLKPIDMLSYLGGDSLLSAWKKGWKEGMKASSSYPWKQWWKLNQDWILWLVAGFLSFVLSLLLIYWLRA